MKTNMSRRDFIKAAASAGLFMGFSGSYFLGKSSISSTNFDLIIKNGMIIDGLKEQSFRADVGIAGEQIKAIDNLQDLIGIDCIVLTVNHDIFRQITLNDLKTIMSPEPVLIDVHRFFDETEAKRMGFHYRSL